MKKHPFVVIQGAHKTQEVNDPRRVKTAKPEDNISEGKDEDNATMLRAMNDAQSRAAQDRGKKVRFSPAKSRRPAGSVLRSAQDSLRSMNATAKQTHKAAMANTIPPGTDSKPDQNTSAKSYFRKTKSASSVLQSKPAAAASSAPKPQQQKPRKRATMPTPTNPPDPDIHKIFAAYKNRGEWPGHDVARRAAHRTYMKYKQEGYGAEAAKHFYKKDLADIRDIHRSFEKKKVKSAGGPAPRPEPDPAPEAPAKKAGIFKRIKSKLFGEQAETSSTVDVIKKLALSEAIRNLGTGSAGSAVRGGRQRKGRKRVSQATMVRKANSDVVQALKSDTKSKATASKVSQARREGEYNKAVERQRMQQYHV